MLNNGMVARDGRVFQRYIAHFQAAHKKPWNLVEYTIACIEMECEKGPHVNTRIRQGYRDTVLPGTPNTCPERLNLWYQQCSHSSAPAQWSPMIAKTHERSAVPRPRAPRKDLPQSGTAPPAFPPTLERYKAGVVVGVGLLPLSLPQ